MPHWPKRETVSKALNAAAQAQVDAMTALADTLEPQLAAAIQTAIDKIVSGADLDGIIAALQSGDANAAMTATMLQLIKDSVAGVVDEAAKLLDAAGHKQSDLLGEGSLGGHAVEVKFNVGNPAVVEWLNAYSLALVRQIQNDTRDSLKAVIGEGLRNGTHPFSQARQIAGVLLQDARAVMGLTDRQALAVVNFRRALEKLDPTALDRALRDKRFDSTVAGAIKTGKPLDHEKIDTMVERYRQRMLKHRAETIARTESIRALNAGQNESMRQAIEQGKIEGVLMRFWSVTADEKTCPICAGIALLNVGGVAMGSEFRSGLGSVEFPPAHPNCRCSIYFVVRTGNALLDALNPVPKVIRGKLETLAASYRSSPVRF